MPDEKQTMKIDIVFEKGDPKIVLRQGGLKWTLAVAEAKILIASLRKAVRWAEKPPVDFGGVSTLRRRKKKKTAW